MRILRGSTCKKEYYTSLFGLAAFLLWNSLVSVAVNLSMSADCSHHKSNIFNKKIVPLILVYQQTALFILKCPSRRVMSSKAIVFIYICLYVLHVRVLKFRFNSSFRFEVFTLDSGKIFE